MEAKNPFEEDNNIPLAEYTLRVPTIAYGYIEAKVTGLPIDAVCLYSDILGLCNSHNLLQAPDKPATGQTVNTNQTLCPNGHVAEDKVSKTGKPFSVCKTCNTITFDKVKWTEQKPYNK